MQTSPITKELDNWAARSGRIAADLVFPPRCVGCDLGLPDNRDGLMLCAGCREELAPRDWVSCRGCGSRVRAGQDPPQSCGRCRSPLFEFDAVVSLGPYQGALREAVLRMKRASERPLSMALGRLFCYTHAEEISEIRPDAVVPIPMFWGRRMVRGVNSASILARTISRQFKLTLADRMVVRCRNTLPQNELGPRQRFQNVRGAFKLNAGYDLAGGRLLLVDDILTTGATCSEVAGVLKKAGAEMVAAAVIARAERVSR